MRRVAPILVAALALSACAGGGGTLGFVGPGDGGQSALRLYGGALTATGPEGYCVDPGVSRPRSGFAAMVGCALISPEPLMPAIDGFLTVQAGEADSAGVAGNEDALAALLTSPEGVALLSATGNPATVAVDAVDQGNGLVTVHFTDFAPPAADGLEPQEWRAFLDLGGRLTTVSIRGFSRAPLSRQQGLRLLHQAVDALRAANGASGGTGGATESI